MAAAEVLKVYMYTYVHRETNGSCGAYGAKYRRCKVKRMPITLLLVSVQLPSEAGLNSSLRMNYTSALEPSELLKRRWARVRHHECVTSLCI